MISVDIDPNIIEAILIHLNMWRSRSTNDSPLLELSVLVEKQDAIGWSFCLGMNGCCMGKNTTTILYTIEIQA